MALRPMQRRCFDSILCFQEGHADLRRGLFSVMLRESSNLRLTWGNEMVRLIRVILLTGCVAMQLHAQAPKEQGLAGQTPAAEPGAAAQTTAAAPAKTQYPLDSFTDFSALMVGSPMALGEGTEEAHIYRSGKLMRMQDPEVRGYFITDLSTLETYGISAGPCMHDTHPYFRASPFAASRPGSTVERVAAGKETLDGHSCQVEEITVSSPQLGARPLKLRFWEAEDLQGFPIRIDFERAPGHTTTVRYKNVVLGPQDPTLFIHPRSCESLSAKPKPTKPKAAPAPKKPAVSPSAE
jgi:hypothetical protein